MRGASQFFTKEFLTQLFSKIICLYGRKVITLQPDTGNDGDTTETNAANSIHTHGYNRNEMRANLLFDFLDKLLTNVKK